MKFVSFFLKKDAAKMHTLPTRSAPIAKSVKPEAVRSYSQYSLTKQ